MKKLITVSKAEVKKIILEQFEDIQNHYKEIKDGNKKIENDFNKYLIKEMKELISLIDCMETF